jgi:hypothetical protein
MWASSRTKTRFDVAEDATVVTLTLMSLMSSTELWEAASSSKTSSEVPSVMATQLGQTLHGDPSEPRFTQLSALARMRAVVVFPVPRGPLNR